MKKITQENMLAALAGESQAHLKYLNFAERAERDGFPNIARIFRAASLSEQIHASNHLRALDGLGDTKANLQTALGGENFEVDEMYLAYKLVAEAQGESRALRMMTWAMEAEKVHAALFDAAKECAEAGSDAPVADIWVCPACGYTMEGEAPDVCPVCGARHDRFHKF